MNYKITFVSHSLNPETGYGADRSLHIVASQLADAGCQVTVIVISPSLNVLPTNLPYRVLHESPVSKSVFNMKQRLKLRKVLRRYENETDVFHLWEPALLLDGAAYRMFGGQTPVVSYLNSYHQFCTNMDIMNNECYKRCGIMSKVQHRPENLLRKVLFLPFRAINCFLRHLIQNKVDAFIACSPSVAEIYSYQHLDKNKMFVIPAGIDYEQLQNLRQNHRHGRLTKDLYNILYIGRLSPVKGIDILIKAVSQLNFPVGLHIIGDGRQRNELEHLVQQLGLSNSVTFHGRLPFEQVFDWYLSSQLFVHPARWPEPLARTILEAMALGVPVIAADSGGAPWALEDANALFKTGDTNDLADKIRLMYANPSLAVDLARRAEKKAEVFDSKTTVPQLLRLYAELITASRKG